MLIIENFLIESDEDKQARIDMMFKGLKTGRKDRTTR